MISRSTSRNRTGRAAPGSLLRLAGNILASLVLVLPALASVSCGGSKSAGTGNSYLKRIGLEPTELDRSIASLNPDMVVEFQDKGNIYLGMTAGGSGTGSSPAMKAIADIRSVSFIIFDDKGTMLDSLYTDVITRSGIGEPESSSLAVSAGVSWRPRPPAPQQYHMIMLIRSVEGAWMREVRTSFDVPLYTESLLLDLKHSRKGAGLSFTLTAERVMEPETEEYLPSGETYRITVYDGPTRLWSSSDGKMFTQAVSPVAPEELGEKVRYEAFWNGTGPAGQAATSGALTIEAMIPAKPTPYILREEIQWNAQ